MAWKEIKTLLVKNSRIVNNNDTLKKEVVRIIQELLKFSISEHDVMLKGRSIIVKAHPAVKNDLMLRKGEILNFLKKSQGEATPLDIR